MKYSRLTTEQFKELHKEFVQFLSANSITGNDWTELKKTNIEKVENILDLFSDIVWEKVLSNTNYLENISKNHIYLFSFDNSKIYFIAIYTEILEVDFTNEKGFNWLRDNLLDDKVKIYNSSKDYSDNILNDKFELIQKGGVITNGNLFKYFNELIID